MNTKLLIGMWIGLSIVGLGCGSKAPAGETTTPPADGEGVEATGGEGTDQELAVQQAKKRIQDWLGKELTEQVKEIGKQIGSDLGKKLAADSKVIGQAKSLGDTVFKDPSVKKKLDEISEKATEGLGNMISLGIKVIKYGGIDNYKAKVKKDTQRVAMEVLTEYIKRDLLADEKTGELMRKIGSELKVHGTIAALALQENLSPRVTKKILSIALTIAAAGDKDELATRVESWIDKCEQPAREEVEKLLKSIADLESVRLAMSGLAAEVLGHETTKTEIATFARNLLNDGQVYGAVVGIYKSAAFEEGDSKVRTSIEQVIKLPVFEQELFKTLEILANKEGAGPIIGKHVAVVGQDPRFAKQVEDFVVNVLEICGDLTQDL